MHHILPHEAALRGWLSRRRAPAAFDVDDIVQESYALLAERERLSSALREAQVLRDAQQFALSQLRSELDAAEQNLRKTQALVAEIEANLSSL